MARDDECHHGNDQKILMTITLIMERSVCEYHLDHWERFVNIILIMVDIFWDVDKSSMQGKSF